MIAREICRRLPLARTAFCAGMVVLASGVASDARADGIIGAFVGANFGGKTEANTRVFGGVLGGVQPRGLGFEIDFGYSPDFFDTEETLGTKTTVTTVMGNLVIGGASDRGVAPFVSGGVGLIRANLDAPTDLVSNLTRNDFGMNIGGGINAMFASNIGVRGDLRYFRSFQGEVQDDNFPDFGIDLSDFDFWRGTVGVVLRW